MYYKLDWVAMLVADLALLHRWKNIQACKQRLRKFFPSLGKICVKFNAVLSQK